MSLDLSKVVLPRPGGAPGPTRTPIPGPSEAAFTETFGRLLPPAKYLSTPNGNAAYYELLPSSESGGKSLIPDRVLLIHGIQTPALGMFPLASELQASYPSTHFVLVDLWGHGLSDTPFAPHDASLFHDLLDALLDRLDWRSVHIIGYSFGGSLTVGYVASRPSRIQSFALVAPAGLWRTSDFTAEEQIYLRGGDESAAQRWIVSLLEGGELIVPADWKQRVGEGKVVAEAVREWQMREHPGHAASVVAIFRDGGVLDNGANFARAVGTGIPSLVVLGGLDDVVSSDRELTEIGFGNVAVVPEAGHAVVRENVPEVAAFINEFWMRQNK